MKRHLTTLLFATWLAAIGSLSAQVTTSRTVQLFNFGWKFHAGDVAEAVYTGYDDSQWRDIDLPHDFQIEQPWVAPRDDEQADNSDPGNNVRSQLSPRGFKAMGIGWYRKTFTPEDGWLGRRVILDFEGIMLVGDVYLNGQLIGGTDYGYLGFDADITSLLKWGEKNVIAVKADSREPENSRWYTGAGIFRDVHIITTDQQQFFTRHALNIVSEPDLTTGIATVDVTAEITSTLRDVDSLLIGLRIIDNKGNVVAENVGKQRYRGNQKTREYNLPTITLSNANRWDIDSPYLYTAEVTLYRSDGTEADKVTKRFGIRKLEFSPAYGFHLNGRKVLLKGIANHHTLGALGAAAYPRAIEKRLRLLKDFGFNHIRTSHNPYSESLIDLCDGLGILVVDELYDKWLTRYAGGRIPWTNLWQHDIPEWIRRDRCHPSVIFWSLGNELQTYWNLPYADWGVTPYRMQKALLQRYDSTRLITVAMHPRGRHQDTDSLPAPLVMETDIAAYNYRYMYFPGDGRRFPWMMFYQSEATTAALGPNYYEMDLDKVIGSAYWGVIDYLGESQGWPAKGWAQGLFYIDLQPKPNAYLARSIFKEEEPVVHICIQEKSQDIEWNGVKQRIRRLTDHWTRTPNEQLNLTVYTNADEAELLVNGKSLGVKQNDRTNPKTRNQIHWEPVTYEAGYIEAVARTAGKVVSRHRVETAGKAVALRLTADNTQWNADGMDLQHIIVQAVDKKGRVVPLANDDITFKVEGNAQLVAVSSGDHYSDEITYTDHRRLFDGQCMAILRSSSSSGEVTVTATCEGLKTARLRLTTHSVSGQ